MQLSNLPAKFPVAWASAAGSGYIKTTPLTSQIGVLGGAASLPDGFVPLNMQPVGSGGKPAWGQDINGILNWITAAVQWFQAGGTVQYDSSFSTSIGGYPKGAMLASTANADLLWMNAADNNTTNPDSSGTNWSAATFPSGTTMLFFQASAPPGWTQVTTSALNDSLLRIVTGVGGGSYTAGQAFSAAVASGTVNGHSISQAELPNCSFSVTDPGHQHFVGDFLYNGGTGGANGGIYGSSNPLNTGSSTTGISVSSGGSGTAHGHGFTGSALNVNYVNGILCTKA